MGVERIAVPRIKQTSPGSKYRYKLTYPNGYVRYVRWPEQLPKEVSNPQDKQRMEQQEFSKLPQNQQKVQVARELLKMANSLLAEGPTMDTDKTARELKAADPDFEKILRELGKITWSYDEWWHRYDDEIEALLEVQFGKEAYQKIREYRKARSAVTTAATDLAGLINEAVEKQG